MMILGVFPLVVAVLLLVVSFFVLVVVTKTESKSLQSFGRILAITLCIFATISIITTIYLSLTLGQIRTRGKFTRMPESKYQHFRK